jgi:excisionase family DNA binding protein
MDELLTVAEVADLLKVNKNKVHDLINAGLLPCLVLGRRKVRRRSLEKFLEDYDGCDISDPWNVRSAEKENQ